MAKCKPVLKWRKVKDRWCAGPFAIFMYFRGSFDPRMETAWGIQRIARVAASLAEAKSACERLARKIIAATKKGRKHGK